MYADVPSAIRPVMHSEEFPVPKPPAIIPETFDAIEEKEEESGETEEYNSPHSKEPHLLTQPDLNDLVRDLNLTKEQAELLGSRLQGWNLLDSSTKITHFRTRQHTFQQYFLMSDDVCICTDIEFLTRTLSFEHVATEWRLFMDSLKTSLKVVLLDITNIYPSIPIAYSVKMKECYESIKTVLCKINYNKYKWKICADLKVIAILLGLQAGYTKYCCFLCEWDSRARNQHYLRKDWPKRKLLTPGLKHIKYENLINAENVILPPLHIKLGIMKNFVKAMDKTGPGFEYLKTKFPGISDAKIKEGIFVGPQIRKLIKDSNFSEKLNKLEKQVWTSFLETIDNFLGNNRSKIMCP